MMASVPSVELSLTMTHFFGSTVCSSMLVIVFSMKASSLYAVVISTYDGLLSVLGSVISTGCEFITIKVLRRIVRRYALVALYPALLLGLLTVTCSRASTVLRMHVHLALADSSLYLADSLLPKQSMTAIVINRATAVRARAARNAVV